MTPERWERVKTLFDAASAHPHRERSAFLARECNGDTDLQVEVEALLDEPLGTADFISLVGGPATALASAPSSDVIASLVGRRIGTFEVLSLLGRGGMGEGVPGSRLRLEAEAAPARPR